MNIVRPAAGLLLERVRKALAHDLRTPLGTIGNYATILEYQGEAQAEDVRAFAARIHASVVQTSAMLTHLSEALRLWTAEVRAHGAEPATILRSLLGELGVQGNYQARSLESQSFPDLDPELLCYCWRAFLAVNACNASVDGLALDISCGEEDGVAIVDLWLSAQRHEQNFVRIDPDAYLLRLCDSAAQDTCLALTLASSLVTARGGELEIFVGDGRASQLRLRMPCSS